MSCDESHADTHFMYNRWEDKNFDYQYYNDKVIIYDEAHQQRVVELCSRSENRNKSIALFGGSHTCSTYSGIYRKYIEEYLNATLTVYGIGGQGFATPSGNVQEQVDRAGIHDIYILWCSTNDLAANVYPGSIFDFTITDGYNQKARKTQCGGINYCIKAIREKNPDAKILMFGSQKFFTSEIGCIWDTKTTNTLGYPYRHYITLQAVCAQRAGIPFFDTWNTLPVNTTNYKPYFLSDHLHNSKTGYANIALYHLEFIATH